jgi:nitrate reductase NapD
MNVSGILVVVPAADTAVAVAELDALPGVEVHHTHPETGRIVVTIEAETVPDEVELLRRIKALPRVVLAEMVYHNFEEDREVRERAALVRQDEVEPPSVPTVLEERDADQPSTRTKPRSVDDERNTP